MSGDISAAQLAASRAIVSILNEEGVGQAASSQERLAAIERFFNNNPEDPRTVTLDAQMGGPGATLAAINDPENDSSLNKFLALMNDPDAWADSDAADEVALEEDQAQAAKLNREREIKLATEAAAVHEGDVVAKDVESDVKDTLDPVHVPAEGDLDGSPEPEVETPDDSGESLEDASTDSAAEATGEPEPDPTDTPEGELGEAPAPEPKIAPEPEPEASSEGQSLDDLATDPAGDVTGQRTPAPTDLPAPEWKSDEQINKEIENNGAPTPSDQGVDAMSPDLNATAGSGEAAGGNGATSFNKNQSRDAVPNANEVAVSAEYGDDNQVTPGISPPAVNPKIVPEDSPTLGDPAVAANDSLSASASLTTPPPGAAQPAAGVSDAITPVSMKVAAELEGGSPLENGPSPMAGVGS